MKWRTLQRLGCSITSLLLFFVKKINHPSIHPQVDMRAKSKTLANLVRRRRAGSFVGAETKDISPPQYSQQKFLIFVKLETQRVFTPMHLNTKTVRGLLRRLESKFPGEVKSSQVSWLT